MEAPKHGGFFFEGKSPSKMDDLGPMETPKDTDVKRPSKLETNGLYLQSSEFLRISINHPAIIPSCGSPPNLTCWSNS